MKNNNNNNNNNNNSNNNNNNNNKLSVAKIVANNIKYSARWKFMLISDQAKDLAKQESPKGDF